MRANLLPLLAVIFVSRSAAAYCLTTTVNEPRDYEPTVTGCWKQGVTLAWPASPIGVRVDARASRKVSLEVTQRVVTESFAKWSDVICEPPATHATFEVHDFGPTLIDISDCTTGPCVRDRLAGAGSILYRDNGWPYDDGPSTYALTTLTYGTTSGHVYGAFLEINTADHDFVERGPAPGGAAALDYVITHESGHFLGLAHSDTVDAIMFSRYRNDGDASLRADDRAAICATRPAADDPGRPGCGCGAASGSPPSAAAFLTLMLAWLRKRNGRAARRRRT
ncbi:MAG: matrixin family metalloprotease [Polyangiales bacterium]